MLRTPAVLALAACTLLLTSCGVAFTSDEGNDFFESMEVSGERVAGAPLTVAISWEQRYPITVDIQCDVLRKTETIKTVGQQTIPAHPEGEPEATPVVGSASYDFTIDEPGTYRIDCYTPLDEDNYLREEITIAPPAGAS